MSQWEMFLSRGGREALSMIQAALIGQTFALLSGVGAPKPLNKDVHNANHTTKSNRKIYVLHIPSMER